MNRITKTRILAILILIVLILASFIALVRIRSITLSVENKDSLNLIYLLLLFVMILAIIQFVIQYSLLLKARERESTILQSANMPSEKEETKKTEEKTTVEEEKETVDIKELTMRLLPEKNVPLPEFCEKILVNLATEFDGVQGIFYVKDKKTEIFNAEGLYAYYSDVKPKDFKEGESLNGQVVKNRKLLFIDNIPDGYVQVFSGLGNSTPKYLLLMPLEMKEEIIGLIEIAFFKKPVDSLSEIFGKITPKIAKSLGERIVDQDKKK